MTRRSRPTSRHIAAVSGVLIVVALLAVSVRTSADTRCEVLQRWARPYTNQSPTLADLVRFDRGHRRAIFNAVTPEVRAALWRAQLDLFQQKPGLSTEQRGLIAEAKGLMTAAFYRHEEAATRAFGTFWQRADGAFGSPDQRRPWFELGASSLLSNGGLASTSSKNSSSDVYCDCHVGGGTGQCGGTNCAGGNGPCQLTSGCGPGGGQTCDGLCQ